MKKNFRFFDNRQKYLLFVTTTNEKNKIADALKPIVQNLKPKNPALKIFDAGMGDGSLLMSVMRQCHQKMPNIPLLVSTKEIAMILPNQFDVLRSYDGLSKEYQFESQEDLDGKSKNSSLIGGLIRALLWGD